MKGKVFGTLVAASVAGLLATSGVAVAKDKKKAGKKEAGWCKSNECAGKVEGAKNDCSGKMACKGITKEQCEKDGKGTWSTDPKPAK
jgi:hypothetical protein